jgi:hypothetical protein
MVIVGGSYDSHAGTGFLEGVLLDNPYVTKHCSKKIRRLIQR